MGSSDDLARQFESEGSVPAIVDERQKAEYAALAQKVYGEVSDTKFTPDQRADSPKGKLASALWTRIAEWDDAREESAD